MDEHLGYEKKSVTGNNSGNCRKQNVCAAATKVRHEKQRISSAALHRISCSRIGSLSSVALFCCIFSFGTFFGFIRIYTVIFSGPKRVKPTSS